MSELLPSDNSDRQVEGDSGPADALPAGESKMADGPVTEEAKAGLLIERLKSEFSQGGGQSAGLEELKRLKKEGSAPAVLKTFLDLDACRQVAYTLATVKETRLREELESKPIEPPKPFNPITEFKQSLPCNSVWDKLQGTERVRFCSQCSLQVYDFSKIELPEAEEQIFQKEGKRKFVLYKRRDGKFLTANCPVAVKRRLMMATAIACGILLLGGLILLLALNPPPKPAANQKPVTSSEPVSGPSTDGNGSSPKSPVASPAGSSPVQAEPQETFSQRMLRARTYTTPVNAPPSAPSEPTPPDGQVYQPQYSIPGGQLNQAQPAPQAAGPGVDGSPASSPQTPAGQAPLSDSSGQQPAPGADSGVQTTTSPNQPPAAPNTGQAPTQQNPYIYQAPASSGSR
jgi:hypothetical protein